MYITNRLGQLTELWCQMEFCERGIVLSQPTNPSSRYDFIAEINGKLYRIQCKTAHKEDNDRISFMVSNKNWNSGEKHNYLGQIDYFYTHWNGKGYLIPIDLCSETSKQKYLRLSKEEQYHSNNINALYGKDYELDVILDSIDPNISKGKITIEYYNDNRDIFESNMKKTEQRQEIVKHEKKEYFCKECGKPITASSNGLCRKCAHKAQRICERPSREELKQMIRTIPFTHIAKKYNVSDKAIVKWCIYYSLPQRKSDINKISDKDWVNI